MGAAQKDFQSFQSLMKSTALQFAKKMITRQFPKLANSQFDIREVGQPCPECLKGIEVDYPSGRTYSNMVPVYQIRMEGSNDWKLVPVDVIPCKQCQDAELGRKAYEAHRDMLVRRKSQNYWRINDELLAASLKNFTPSDPSTIQALKAAKDFLDDWKAGKHYSFILRGSYGAGKSHLLKAAAEIIKSDYRKENGERYTVGFLPMEDILTMIKSTWGTDDESRKEQTIIRDLIDLDFLVLDDVGTEGGEWAGKKLFEIINGRMGKPTGITTNFMDWEAFSKRFGENGGKIVSRLRSKAKIIDVETTDKRISEL